MTNREFKFRSRWWYSLPRPSEFLWNHKYGTGSSSDRDPLTLETSAFPSLGPVATAPGSEFVYP